jgi:hypothetical protein
MAEYHLIAVAASRLLQAMKAIDMSTLPPTHADAVVVRGFIRGKFCLVLLFCGEL